MPDKDHTTSLPLFGEGPVERHKRCCYCKQLLPLSEFHRDSSFRDGLNPRCKECERAARQNHDKSQLGFTTFPLFSEGSDGPTKCCVRCREIKPLSEFVKDKHDRQGVTRYCKECLDKYRKERYSIPAVAKARRKLDRFYQRKKKYGISRYDYDRMFLAQNGLCAICGRPPKDEVRHEDLHVDHCHTTGKVRGLLCDDCNIGLGRFKDDVEILTSAIAYLKRSRG